MKNIKKIKDEKKSASKDSLVRDDLKKTGAKEVIKCPEMGM